MQSESRFCITPIAEEIAIPAKPGEIPAWIAKVAVANKQKALRSWVLIESQTSNVQEQYLNNFGNN